MATPTSCSSSAAACSGGKVYGKWPGLAPEQLNEGRDLAVTTDFRRVLAEASYKTLGAHNLSAFSLARRSLRQTSST